MSKTSPDHNELVDAYLRDGNSIKVMPEVRTARSGMRFCRLCGQDRPKTDWKGRKKDCSRHDEDAPRTYRETNPSAYERHLRGPEAFRELRLKARRLSAETGVRHVVDHVIPLRSKVMQPGDILVSGLHVPGNFDVIPEHVNRKKWLRFPADAAEAEAARLRKLSTG